MLLRSASSPLLNCARALADYGAGHHLAVMSPSSTRQGAALCRVMSEGDLAAPLFPLPAVAKKYDGHHVFGRAPTPLSASSSASFSVEEDAEEEEAEYEEEDVVAASPVPLRRLLTSTGLDSLSPSSSPALAFVEEDGVGGGGGGRKACGGGGTPAGGGSDSHGAADAHYRRMIDADPGNALLLLNYARFLKDVDGDAARAQEYCERAILADPADADALALYAGLVWEATGDAARADDYYTRAVQAAPDDCYVLGSYAGFLWDAEEENDDDTEQMPPPPLLSPFPGAAQPPFITAAS